MLQSLRHKAMEKQDNAIVLLWCTIVRHKSLFCMIIPRILLLQDQPWARPSHINSNLERHDKMIHRREVSNFQVNLQKKQTYQIHLFFNVNLHEKSRCIWYVWAFCRYIPQLGSALRGSYFMSEGSVVVICPGWFPQASRAGFPGKFEFPGGQTGFPGAKPYPKINSRL